MKYKFLSKDINNKNFSIRNIDYSQIEFIRCIRNNQIKFLRQKKIISKSEQYEYFNKVVLPETKKKNPSLIFFGLFQENKIIGYGGFVHISWFDKRTELSLLIDNSINSKTLFECYSIFIDLSLKLAFDYFGFLKISTETYSNRRKIISILEKKKFKLEGILKKHVNINGKFLNSYLHAKYK